MILKISVLIILFLIITYIYLVYIFAIKSDFKRKKELKNINNIKWIQTGFLTDKGKILSKKEVKEFQNFYFIGRLKP
jgi:hypothetical protein